MIPQLLATIALLLALLGPPDMVADVSWYGGPHHGQLTASGQVYSIEGHTCAIRREKWEAGWACGYGRGECKRVLICPSIAELRSGAEEARQAHNLEAGGSNPPSAIRCVVVSINDTGAWGWAAGHEFDCTPRVFENTVGNTDIGIGQVRAWRLP